MNINKNQSPNMVVVLDNIRSAQNVGAIFRTADACGIGKIFLCGVTPTPIDRFGRKRSDIKKSALGAEDSVLYEYFPNTIDCILHLKESKYEIVMLEQDAQAIDYKNYKVEKDMALVVGTEVTGISKEILALADVIIEIPMRGKKESLNVSVSTGIALARITDL